MAVEALKRQLALWGEINDGCNHGSEYLLEALPAAVSLQDALDAYFAAYSTGRTGPRPASEWGIRIRPLATPWPDTLHERLHHWCFEQEYSPRPAPAAGAQQIAEWIEGLRRELAVDDAHEVVVAPPMEIWYGCVWQDFALRSPHGRWLLHLGFSD
jgi:hypothetical protein